MDFKPVAPYSDKQFLHTQTAAVVVPLMQSAVTGVIVFIIALVVSLKFRSQDLLSVPLLLAVLSFGGTWLWLQKRWLTLTNLERITGLDLNRDELVGDEPVSKRVTVIRIEKIGEDNHYQSRDFTLPASEEQLIELAKGLAFGRPFGEREWSGAGKPFSSQEFRSLKTAMLKYLLIERVSDKDPRQGFRLTEEGIAWRDNYSPPLQKLDD